MSLPDYAELLCCSNFSFLRGASHAEELVLRAQAMGYTALAITDECSMAGVVRAHLAAQEAGLKLLIGTELRITAPELACGGFTLVLLARHRQGYGQLCELITAARGREQRGRERYRLHWQQPPLSDAPLGDVLALLPLEGEQGQAVALVWSMDHARAAQHQALPPEALARHLA